MYYLTKHRIHILIKILVKLVDKLLQVIIGYTYTSLLVVYLPYNKAS